MAKTKKSKLPPAVIEAIKDKVEVLQHMEVIKRSEEDAIQKHFELAIETQPERDPYVVMDQIAHTYMERVWKK